MLELVLFEGNMVGSYLNINAYGALGTYYSELHAENRDGQIVLTGTRKADNALLATADTSNSAGAVLLWNCGEIKDGTELSSRTAPFPTSGTTEITRGPTAF